LTAFRQPRYRSSLPASMAMTASLSPPPGADPLYLMGHLRRGPVCLRVVAAQRCNTLCRSFCKPPESCPDRPRASEPPKGLSQRRAGGISFRLLFVKPQKVHRPQLLFACRTESGDLPVLRRGEKEISQFLHRCHRAVLLEKFPVAPLAGLYHTHPSPAVLPPFCKADQQVSPLPDGLGSPPPLPPPSPLSALRL